MVASPEAPRGKATKTGTGTRLVIVESPGKAKKIAGFRGVGYIVRSSIGHIRGLPRNPADVPAIHKGQARLGVDRRRLGSAPHTDLASRTRRCCSW